MEKYRYTPSQRPISYFLARGLPWLAIAALLPMIVVYFQTYRASEMTLRMQSERILDFLVAESDFILGNTERMMDKYLLETGGSCGSTDLAKLRRHISERNTVESIGIIAADGLIACFVGKKNFEKFSFPEYNKETQNDIQFATLRLEDHSMPIMIKAQENGIRMFSVISSKRFNRLFLPRHMINFGQLDLLMPGGEIWYSLSGKAISDGFSEKTIAIDKKSTRFPVEVSLVLDQLAITQWSGSLRSAIIVIMCLSMVALLFGFFAHKVFNALQKRYERRQRRINLENTRLHFEPSYQPLLNLDSKLLVGVVVRFDFSVFDKVPDAKPSADRLIAMVWQQIGEFALQRREFNLIIEIDGDSVVDADHRPAVVEQLKKIGYENLSLLMKWPTDKGVDGDLYRPLEEVATAGANLAIECGAVRFSLLSDMWAWPYHQLMIDFASLPETDESMTWMSEIVMNMGEQLQVDTVGLGIEKKEMLDAAISGGFRVGAGEHLGPQLTFDALMSAVRPAGSKNNQQDKQAA